VERVPFVCEKVYGDVKKILILISTNVAQVKDARLLFQEQMKVCV
jgi:hypothetical protein